MTPHRWATGAVRLATTLLEPGPARERYRRELVSELWGLGTRAQLGHAVSTLLGAPALRRALRATGELALPHSVWWCRLTLHHRWRRVRTEEGATYRRCRACGSDDDGTMGTPEAAAAGLIVYGIQPQ